MKNLLILISVCFLFTLQTYAQTNTVTSTSSTVSGTTSVDRTPSTASAPSIMNSNQERLKLSRSLYRMGMKVGAVALLCQDERVFQAMEMAGTPCPYMGKIGIDAAKEWANNPEKRPDYDKWVKENAIKEEEIVTDEGALGIFSVILMLLFI